MTPVRCPSCGHTHAAPPSAADALLAALPRQVLADVLAYADASLAPVAARTVEVWRWLEQVDKGAPPPRDDRDRRTIEAQQAEIEDLRRSRAALIDGPIAAAVQRDAEKDARIAALEAKLEAAQAMLHNVGLPLNLEPTP